MALLAGSTEPAAEKPSAPTPPKAEPVVASVAPVIAVRPAAAVPAPSGVTGYPVTPAVERNPAAAPPVSKAQIIEWTRRNTPDDVIIERISASRTVFQMTAADQNELQDSGVSRAVIQAMKETMRR